MGLFGVFSFESQRLFPPFGIVLFPLPFLSPPRRFFLLLSLPGDKNHLGSRTNPPPPPPPFCNGDFPPFLPDTSSTEPCLRQRTRLPFFFSPMNHKHTPPALQWGGGGHPFFFWAVRFLLTKTKGLPPQKKKGPQRIFFLFFFVRSQVSHWVFLLCVPLNRKGKQHGSFFLFGSFTSHRHLFPTELFLQGGGFPNVIGLFSPPPFKKNSQDKSKFWGGP